LTIYRATEGDEIRAGDYVTNSYEYAKLHLEAVLRGEGKIIKKEGVGLDELHAVNPNEFFYVPKWIQEEVLGGIVPIKGDIVPAFGLRMKPTTHHQKQIAINMFRERVEAGEIKGWRGELYLAGSFLEEEDTEYSDVDIVMQTVDYFSPDMASDLFNIQKDILQNRGVFIDVLHKFPEEPYELLLKVEKKPEATATFVAGEIPPELTPAEVIKAKKQKALAEIPIEERQRIEAERKHRELKRRESEEREKRHKAIVEGKKKPAEYLDSYIGQTNLNKFVKLVIFVGAGVFTLNFLDRFR